MQHVKNPSYREAASNLATHIPMAAGADMETTSRHAAIIAACRALYRAEDEIDRLRAELDPKNGVKTLRVKTYTTDDGQPTCCRHIEGMTCQFLGTMFGVTFSCLLGKNTAVYRDDQGRGFIRPHKGCPLHYEKPEESC